MIKDEIFNDVMPCIKLHTALLSNHTVDDSHILFLLLCNNYRSLINHTYGNLISNILIVSNIK